MNKRILIVVGIPLLLFSWLYWGLDTTSPEQSRVLIDKEMSIPVLNFESELSNAKTELETGVTAQIEQLENEAGASTDIANKVNALKELSGIWSRNKQYYLAGIYAERIAEIEEIAEAWGIAGTTFLLGVQEHREDRVRQRVLQGKAIQALENAISADPNQIDYRINLALAYIEAPPEDQPMKGIQLLLDLKEKYPQEAKVSAQLGRLAMQTGQTEKAFERYLEANKLGLSSKEIVCLLAQLAQQLKKEEAAQFAELCNSLITTNKE